MHSPLSPRYRPARCCVLLAFLLIGSIAPLQARQDEAPSLGFAEGDCPFPEIENVTCGYLTVPEDRSQPDGNLVELAVAIISPLNDDPDAIPVLYLEGGPGGSALLGTDSFLSEPIAENHTVILFDQRGTGFSLPSLNCYELEEDSDADPDADPTEACRYRLSEDEGIDLQQYNSANSAADAYDLVMALGYDQVALWGISYGTKLGLTIMRDTPEIVYSAVLDSVYALETDDLTVQITGFLSALNELFDQCANDDVCNDAYPTLADDFYTLLDTLDADPVDVDDEGIVTTVDGATLYNMLFQTFYDTQAIPFLPYGITLMAYAESEEDFTYGYRIVANLEFPIEVEGAPEINAPIAESDMVLDYFDQYGQIDDSEGMSNSVDCQEEYQLNDADAAVSIAESAPTPLRSYFVDNIISNITLCETWGVQTADLIETERVISDIPTLLLAGSFDPITPVASAESALEGLSDGVLLVFPAAGHAITVAVTDSGACAKTLMLGFLYDPSAPLDEACINATSAIEFYVE